MSLKYFFPLFVATALATAACSSGDGSHAGEPPPEGDAAPAVDPQTLPDAGPIEPNAACAGTVETHVVQPWKHVAIGTPIDYTTNPPSSGPHYPIWASYGTHSNAVDRGYYVHDLEHGAVVLLYKCDAADGCPDVVRGLQAVADAIPDDPICTTDPAVKKRFVITPDPLLDVPVAAATWGWTYKAPCLDVGSLGDFARAHYGQGRESTCDDGAAL
jgi:hypothetical protein